MKDPVKLFNSHYKSLITEAYMPSEKAVDNNIYECPVCGTQFKINDCDIIQDEHDIILHCPECYSKLIKEGTNFILIEKFENTSEKVQFNKYFDHFKKLSENSEPIKAKAPIYKTFTITFFHNGRTYTGALLAKDKKDAENKFNKWLPSCTIDRILPGRLCWDNCYELSSTIEQDLGWAEDPEDISALFNAVVNELNKRGYTNTIKINDLANQAAEELAFYSDSADLDIEQRAKDWVDKNTEFLDQLN